MKDSSFFKLVLLKYGAAVITILTTTFLASKLSAESYAKFSLIINLSTIASTVALFGVHRNFPYDYKQSLHRTIELYAALKIRILNTIQFLLLPVISILISIMLFTQNTIRQNEIIIVTISIFGISASLAWFQSIQFLNNFIRHFTERSFLISLITRVLFCLASAALLLLNQKNPFYLSGLFSLICMIFLLYEIFWIQKTLTLNEKTKKINYFASAIELKKTISRSKWIGLDSVAALLISIAPSVIVTTINPEASAGMNLSLTLVNGSLMIAGIMQIKLNSIIFNSKKISLAIEASYSITWRILLFWLSTQIIVMAFLFLMRAHSEVFAQASGCYHYILIGGLFSFANKFMIPFLMSRGLDQQIFKSTIISGVISLVLGGILIPKFQVYGSITTFIIGYFVSFLFLSLSLFLSKDKN